MSDEELAESHEQLRQRWVAGDGSVRRHMEKLDGEMTLRSNKRYVQENPDARPVRREHGWYLPDDD